MNSRQYLEETAILDFSNAEITQLIKDRDWAWLNDYEKIGAIYTFVKDEIHFGYNKSDDIPASSVLNDGYGQCNTKSTLFMALLRATNIPCRFHGFTINNALQLGAIPSYIFRLAPRYIIHSWVEVFYQERWVSLEGFIIDAQMLTAVQTKFKNIKGEFCGYGIATKNLLAPPVDWEGQDTYIQKEGIHDDFGVYDNPDQFYFEHGKNLSGIKKILFSLFLRHVINLNLKLLKFRYL